jgi:hypothetical protein
MAVTSYKRMKDLLTDEDVYRVLDIEDESDIFCKESDDFWFDTSDEDSEGDLDTSSIVHESELCEEVSYFSQPFVHSVQQKSIGQKFSKFRTGSDVRYSCHHNLSRFTFPIFAHSWRFYVVHSLQSITHRIYKPKTTVHLLNLKLKH